MPARSRIPTETSRRRRTSTNLDGDFACRPITSRTTARPASSGRRRFRAPSCVDWQIAAINSVYSGEPVTFVYTPLPAVQVSGIEQDFRGANNYRPNVDRRSRTRPRASARCRTGSIATTSSCRPIRASRSAMRSGTACAGPVFWQIDLALSRRIPMPWPAGAVELRAEFFNLLNRTNFRAPNGNRSAAAFGTITHTYDPRQAQLGVEGPLLGHDHDRRTTAGDTSPMRCAARRRSFSRCQG